MSRGPGRVQRAVLDCVERWDHFDAIEIATKVFHGAFPPRPALPVSPRRRASRLLVEPANVPAPTAAQIASVRRVLRQLRKLGIVRTTSLNEWGRRRWQTTVPVRRRRPQPTAPTHPISEQRVNPTVVIRPPKTPTIH